MIIFVCTGNTCRSPLAESYMKTLTDLPVESRGLFVTSSVVNENSKKIIQENNLVSPTTPKQLTYEDTLGSTILVMTEGHKYQVKKLNADADVHLLSEYAGESGDIMDPFGGNIDMYNHTFNEIKNYIDRIK